MKEKKGILLIAGLSGAIGGAFGAVSGSSSLVVVGIVSAVIAVFFAWIISGMVK